MEALDIDESECFPLDTRPHDDSELMRHSKLARKVEELCSHYVTIETAFLTHSTNTAMDEDENDTVQNVQVMKSVEDFLFLCRKATRRSFMTLSALGASSVVNTVGNVLITDFVAYLDKQMKKSSKKRFDFMSLRQTEDDDVLPYHVWVNSAQYLIDLSPKYFNDATEYYEALSQQIGSNDTGKIKVVIENNRSELQQVASNLINVGVQKLSSSAFSSKIKTLLSLLPFTSYELTEDDFDAVDSACPQMFDVITALEKEIAQMKDVLLPRVFDQTALRLCQFVRDSLVDQIGSGSYNLLGGLQVERDVSCLVSSLSRAVRLPISDVFAQAVDMALLLSLDDVESVYNYYSSSPHSTTWHLNARTTKETLSKRTDLDADKVATLVL
eukprot:m.218936 g.218936  ORF g.218936 m.218936 type:complete len:385 (+) comp13820_c0_seq2:953-2107(+)